MLVSDSVLTKCKRLVYKELKEPFINFDKSYRTGNNNTTYKLACDLLSKYGKVLSVVKDNIIYVEEYIDINITAKENIQRYKDLLVEVKLEVTKADSFLKRTQSYFDRRQYTYPFIMNKETIEIINHAIKKLIGVFSEAYAYREGVTKDGITFLVELV